MSHIVKYSSIFYEVCQCYYGYIVFTTVMCVVLSAPYIQYALSCVGYTAGCFTNKQDRE